MPRPPQRIRSLAPPSSVHPGRVGCPSFFFHRTIRTGKGCGVVMAPSKGHRRTTPKATIKPHGLDGKPGPSPIQSRQTHAMVQEPRHSPPAIWYVGCVPSPPPQSSRARDAHRAPRHTAHWCPPPATVTLRTPQSVSERSRAPRVASGLVKPEGCREGTDWAHAPHAGSCPKGNLPDPTVPFPQS